MSQIYVMLHIFIITVITLIRYTIHRYAQEVILGTSSVCNKCYTHNVMCIRVAHRSSVC